MTARENLEAWIEQLIALLDALDGDPDLEPSIAPAMEWTGEGFRYTGDEREQDDAIAA